MKCRHCFSELNHTFLDLGFAPPSNSYLTKDDLTKPEKYYPLKVMVCDHCWLVQTEDYAQADELFDSEYAYFSSTSTGWLEHAKQYADMIIQELGLNEKSLVIELASNDGYLLKNFVEKKIPCLGIEPTASTAKAAKALGIPVLQDFFGEQLGKQLAQEGRQADLITGNNVYAHVPDINDFTLGLAAALKPSGTITLEFPHLMRLIEFNQFDTIYHEHFSYLSLNTVARIFKNAGLRVWNVEELPTHGGSLRIYGCHESDVRQTLPTVQVILEKEKERGLQNLSVYESFQEKADAIKNEFLEFLITQKKLGKKVVAYGAAAKGNTLLNYAGVKPDLLTFVCDAAAAKQNKFMPGSHIPIMKPEALFKEHLDFVVILPWNIEKEVREQNIQLAKSGTQFVTAVPSLKYS
ncbi:class I SAM-dependent methyltransferase [Polynucleobacter paneuropaeus]|uniref:class I SAM-dependent methyltransferase n=1 Tax=Polynucleobacter paneuropaeus TaxID=2527775 RepID=UPI000DBF2F0D|nr:class I SAM-dependent methyltransferase [Polynucleobacter paneuropaeus]AWW44049.1 SAM-dependent methyltransferase [Polynucleobacter paneuropaeus]